MAAAAAAVGWILVMKRVGLCCQLGCWRENGILQFKGIS